jgi:hypothetical protein
VWLLPAPDDSRRAHSGRLANLVESSAVMRVARPVLAGSLVWRALACLGRSFSGRDSWSGRLVSRHPPSRDLARATDIASGSALVGFLGNLIDRVEDAWRQSATRGAVRRHLDSGLQPWQRVRAVGWVLVVASAVHASLDAASVFATRWRLIPVALAAAAGLVLLIAARPLAAALHDRPGRKSTIAG